MEAKKFSRNSQQPNIIEDVLLNILSRIPVTNLCRSKLVSKRWLSLIEDPLFSKARPKQRSQWIRLPPPNSCRPMRLNPITGEKECAIDDFDIHIYSIDDKGPSIVVETLVPPPDTFMVKHYTGFICSYHESSQLTVFNTATQESVTAYLPISEDKRFMWNFEYGFDPLSKKYKVLSYEHFGSSIANPIYAKYAIVSQCPFEPHEESNFEVFTLGGDDPTWRSIRNIPKIKYLPYWVTNVDGKLFWFIDDHNYTRKPAEIISFDLTKEEFAIVKLPNNSASYFKCPLFQFEGSLGLVENLNPKELQSIQLELNVWSLRDIENSCWVKIRNFTLCLGGTDLGAWKNIFYDNCSIYSPLKEAEFCAQNGEMLIVIHDNKDQYLFTCDFLNGQCERKKTVGQLIQHLGVKQFLDFKRNG